MNYEVRIWNVEVSGKLLNFRRNITPARNTMIAAGFYVGVLPRVFA